MIFLNVLIAFLVDAYQVNMDQLIGQRNNKDKEVRGGGGGGVDCVWVGVCVVGS